MLKIFTYFFIGINRLNIISFICFSKDESRIIETTSISPIPRPVSSINVSTLIAQSSFPVCISPPPSPSCPQVSSLANNQSIIASAVIKSSGLYETAINEHLDNESISTTHASSNDPTSHCEETEVITSILKRAMSCDSICSDTSVALGDLEMFNITGYLCVGLEYDR